MTRVDVVDVQRRNADQPAVEIDARGLATRMHADAGHWRSIHLSPHLLIDFEILGTVLRIIRFDRREGSDRVLQYLQSLSREIAAAASQRKGEVHVRSK